MKPPGDVATRAEFEVRPTTRRVAIDLVVRYHYTGGGANTGVRFDGLFRIGSDECLGVAWWMPPTKVAALTVSENWTSVLCLTRLVVDPIVPTNGASLLLGGSIRALRAEGRWRHLLTYADEGQGHTGSIYRATNWNYRGTIRRRRGWLTPEGRQVAAKSTVNRTAREMERLGYHRSPISTKHKFTLDLA